jgi:GNAT superfamily N-acetyltransferase
MCTTVAENPHCGILAVPFMNKTTSLDFTAWSIRCKTSDIMRSLSYRLGAFESFEIKGSRVIKCRHLVLGAMVRCVKRTRVNRDLMMNMAEVHGVNVRFRAAVTDDATALRDIFLQAIAVSTPGLPLAHTGDEIAKWMATKMVPEKTVTVAVAGDVPVAFVTSDHGWIHQLFVSPHLHRSGLGTALIAPILSCARTRIRLWTFQRNAQGRAFYERHGFKAELFTDGADNEERTPDVLYVWRPS